MYFTLFRIKSLPYRYNFKLENYSNNFKKK